MRANLILLSCALLAICLGNLPVTDGEVCILPGIPINCVDCTLEPTDPECATTAAAAETTAAAGDDETTVAPAEDTTAGADADAGGETTTEASAPGEEAGGKKTGRNRAWKLVRRPGKKVIKRRRQENNKSIFDKWVLKDIDMEEQNPTTEPETDEVNE